MRRTASVVALALALWAVSLAIARMGVRLRFRSRFAWTLRSWGDGGQCNPFAFLIGMENPDWDHVTDLYELMRILDELGTELRDMDQAAAIWA